MGCGVTKVVQNINDDLKMVSKKDVKRDCSCHTAGMEIMELKAEVVVEVNTNGVIYENYSVRVYLNLIVVVTVEVLN